MQRILNSDRTWALQAETHVRLDKLHSEETARLELTGDARYTRDGLYNMLWMGQTPTAAELQGADMMHVQACRD